MADERTISTGHGPGYPLDRPRPIERQTTPILEDGPVISALPNLRVPGPAGWATARINTPPAAERAAATRAKQPTIRSLAPTAWCPTALSPARPRPVAFKLAEILLLLLVAALCLGRPPSAKARRGRQRPGRQRPGRSSLVTGAATTPRDPARSGRSAVPRSAVADNSMRRLRDSQPPGSRWLSSIDRWGLGRPQIVLAASAVLAALALLVPGTTVSAIVLAVAVLIGPAVVLVNILGFDGHASRWAVGLGTALSTLVIWALAVQMVRVLSDWRIHTVLALVMLFGGLGALWFVVGRRVLAETELGERAAATWNRCTRFVQRHRPADRHERHAERRGPQSGGARAVDQDRGLGHRP